MATALRRVRTEIAPRDRHSARLRLARRPSRVFGRAIALRRPWRWAASAAAPSDPAGRSDRTQPAALATTIDLGRDADRRLPGAIQDPEAAALVINPVGRDSRLPRIPVRRKAGADIPTRCDCDRSLRGISRAAFHLGLTQARTCGRKSAAARAYPEHDGQDAFPFALWRRKRNARPPDHWRLRSVRAVSLRDLRQAWRSFDAARDDVDRGDG